MVREPLLDWLVLDDIVLSYCVEILLYTVRYKIISSIYTVVVLRRYVYSLSLSTRLTESVVTAWLVGWSFLRYLCICTCSHPMDDIYSTRIIYVVAGV